MFKSNQDEVSESVEQTNPKNSTGHKFKWNDPYVRWFKWESSREASIEQGSQDS